MTGPRDLGLSAPAEGRDPEPKFSSGNESSARGQYLYTMRALALSSFHGTAAAIHRACARTNFDIRLSSVEAPDLRLAVGGLQLSCGADHGG